MAGCWSSSLDQPPGLRDGTWDGSRRKGGGQKRPCQLCLGHLARLPEVPHPTLITCHWPELWSLDSAATEVRHFNFFICRIAAQIKTVFKQRGNENCGNYQHSLLPRTPRWRTGEGVLFRWVGRLQPLFPSCSLVHRESSVSALNHSIWAGPLLWASNRMMGTTVSAFICLSLTGRSEQTLLYFINGVGRGQAVKSFKQATCSWNAESKLYLCISNRICWPHHVERHSEYTSKNNTHKIKLTVVNIAHGEAHWLKINRGKIYLKNILIGITWPQKNDLIEIIIP